MQTPKAILVIQRGYIYIYKYKDIIIKNIEMFSSVTHFVATSPLFSNELGIIKNLDDCEKFNKFPKTISLLNLFHCSQSISL